MAFYNGVNVFVRLATPLSIFFNKHKKGCGDGFRTYPEECDDGNQISGDGCSKKCKVELGYKCIGGSYYNSQLDVCSVYTSCGDAVVAGSEECDDGNFIDGDGCSKYCTKELISNQNRYDYSKQNIYILDPVTNLKYYDIENAYTDPALSLYWVF